MTSNTVNYQFPEEPIRGRYPCVPRLSGPRRNNASCRPPRIVRLSQLNIFRLLGLTFSCIVTIASTVTAQNPTIEPLGSLESTELSKVVVGADGIRASITGNTLQVQTTTGLTRSVTLSEAIQEALSGGSLHTTFAIRPDGMALIAPPFMTGHVVCPYYIIDTNSGTVLSSSYEGAFRTFGRGETSTDCHQGISANPTATQFALAPTSRNKNITLIAYDTSRTTLTPAFTEEASLAGRIVYVSRDLLVAGYFLSFGLEQRFILFNLTTGEQSVLPIAQTNTLFYPLKSQEQAEIIFLKSDSSSLSQSATSIVAYNLTSSTFTTLREPTIEFALPDDWPYRDLVYESSVGSQALFRSGQKALCDVSNGSPFQRAQDVCVLLNGSSEWEPLQCFVPKSVVSTGAPWTGIGFTTDGALVAGVDNQLFSIRFSPSSTTGVSRYCAHLEPLSSSSCLNILGSSNDFGYLSFSKGRSKRTCTLRLKLTVGGENPGEGSVVRFLKKTRQSGAPSRTIATRRTDSTGIVTFRVQLKDFARQNGVTSSGIFQHAGSSTMRPAEFRILP